MGNPIPPENPDYGNCPDCCEKMPSTINCSLIKEPYEGFEGTLTNSVQYPCIYHGFLTGNYEISMILRFCYLGDFAYVYGYPIPGYWLEPDIKCNPYYTVVTGNYELRVWW